LISISNVIRQPLTFARLVNLVNMLGFPFSNPIQEPFFPSNCFMPMFGRPLS
jgi:hypothetical protein